MIKSSEEELLKRPHYAIIVNNTRSIHYEGDERSRINPGHGYPSYTETVNTIEYLPFQTKEEIVDWVKYRRHSESNYRIISVTPMKAETTITLGTEN